MQGGGNGLVSRFMRLNIVRDEQRYREQSSWVEI